jgi:hypothetical protein
MKVLAVMGRLWSADAPISMKKSETKLSEMWYCVTGCESAAWVGLGHHVAATRLWHIRRQFV